jgi:hypothetical protein
VIPVQSHPEGFVIEVRAQPGARRNEVRGVHRGALKMSVTQIAEKGKANHAIRDLLARTLHLNRSQVELLQGSTTSQKRFLIRGLDADQLQQRLQQAVDQPPTRPPDRDRPGPTVAGDAAGQ